MRKGLIFVTLLLCIPVFIFSQSFQEWNGNGWGLGLNEAMPVITDLDSDNLLDLLIGTYTGSIHHFEQTSMNSNSFSLVKYDFNQIDVGIYASPAITDIDEDGLLDLIVGQFDGKLFHYEQVTEDADSFMLVTDQFLPADVDRKASPYFTDLDDDNLLDLIIGTLSGNLFHYEQEAAASDSFILVTDSINIDLPTMRTNPTVTDLDHDGLLDLIIGGNFGRLEFYEQDVAGSNSFVLISDDLIDLDNYVYSGTRPYFYDIDSDGLIDLLVGEMDGLYYHFEQTEIDSVEFSLQSSNILGLMDVGSGAAPCVTDLDNDDLIDMIVGEWHGNINHFEQASSGSLDFILVSDSLGGESISDYSYPSLTDLDGDGLFDLIMGERDGTLNHFEQDSENPNSFNLVTEFFNGIDIERYASPFLMDIDGDNRIDMLLGENVGKLYVYEQQTVGSNIFDLLIDSLEVSADKSDPAPYVIDYDSDGLLDLFVGRRTGEIEHYEQNEANTFDFNLIIDKFQNIDVGRRARVAFSDINADGKKDLIVGEQSGGLRLYLYQSGTDIQMPEPDNLPNKFHLSKNYPNPFNPTTKISYSLPAGRQEYQVTLKVFDVLGRELRTLVNKEQSTGNYEVVFDASGLTSGIECASGVYFYRIQVYPDAVGAGEFVETKKMILLK
ncbi:MAG: FG-GAP-like repeat-containing protein [Bacteroidota bacterium]